MLASAKRLGGEGFEDIELSDIAELLDSHPQKIVQKYFSDVITSKVDREGHCNLRSRTQSMLKHPLCKSNCCDDSEQRDPSVEHLLTLRGEEAGPSGHVIQTGSANKEKGHIQRAEPWDSDFGSSDNTVIHVPENASGAED
ncbi:Ankyrin Repeat, Sam And Basic Leucine Zipper Domain-Containing Protein 1 [Manis pentadactyla]|nr:Ankyrin Repeat, Sam And Basic Leucine Zipper Domain-Containing Protein 1 [Manis pentadactyla]